MALPSHTLVYNNASEVIWRTFNIYQEQVFKGDACIDFHLTERL